MDSPTKAKITDLAKAGDVDGYMSALNDYLSGFDYKRGYNECVDFLDDNFAFFLTHVLNMGKPEFDPSIPTAAVYLPSKKGVKSSDFKFIFNPTFFAMLNVEERSFVLGHETMHVLLNHLALLRKGKESGKFTNQRKFNIAADCVINDYLVGMGLEPGRLADFGAFGEKIVGYNCANATVGEVYLDIPDAEEDGQDGEKGQNGEGEGQSGGGQGSGDPLEDFMKAAGAAQSFDDHEWMEANDQSQEQAAEDIAKSGKNAGNSMPEDLEDKKDDGEGASKYGSPGGGPGTGSDAMMTKWKEESGVSMAWAELLKEIDPDMFKKGGPPLKPSYHQPRRKLGGVNAMRRAQGLRPVMLPVERLINSKDGEIPSIFMALDVSGSCAHHANTFVTLAKSVPQDKIKLHVATFAYDCHHLDLENPKWVGGGTSFGPVEQYIRTNVVPEFGHYPKAVVMVTDGEGGFNGTRPSTEDAEKWLWLITDGGRYIYPDVKTVGRIVQYEDYAKGVKGAKI